MNSVARQTGYSVKRCVVSPALRRTSEHSFSLGFPIPFNPGPIGSFTKQRRKRWMETMRYQDAPKDKTMLDDFRRQSRKGFSGASSINKLVSGTKLDTIYVHYLHYTMNVLGIDWRPCSIAH